MRAYEIHSVRLSVPLQERGSNHEGSFADLDEAIRYLHELSSDNDCLMAEVVAITPAGVLNQEAILAQGERSFSRRGDRGPVFGPWKVLLDDHLYVKTRGRDAQIKLLGD